MNVKRALHRGMRASGLHLQRWRDPYSEAAALLKGHRVEHVVDGGAYHGGVSTRLASLFPEATVHAFEPQADSFAHLQRKFADEPRVKLYHRALSDQVGSATLHVNRKAFTTSLLPTTEAAVMDPVGNQEIETTTLDRWAIEQGVQPSLIKLDLQGHELAALRGAEDVLREVKIALVEVNFRSRYAGSCLFHEVAARLHESGFYLHRLYEIITDPGGGWKLADALFLKHGL